MNNRFITFWYRLAAIFACGLALWLVFRPSHSTMTLTYQISANGTNWSAPITIEGKDIGITELHLTNVLISTMEYNRHHRRHNDPKNR